MRDPSHPPTENPLETLLLDAAGPPVKPRRWIPKLLLAVLLLVLVLAGWWSCEPATLVLPAVERGLLIPGDASAGMLTGSLRTLLNKPGGLLANDVAPPGIWLDDMPSFEAGALDASRIFLQALLHDFGRSRNQSVEDPDLLRAEPRLTFDIRNWRVPAAEDEYRDAIAAVDAWHTRLKAKPAAAYFEFRDDALAHWLDRMIAELERQSRQLVKAPTRASSQVDDAFYYTRGWCWMLQAQLSALRRESMLATPQRDAAFVAALQALDGARLPMRSPVVLNGSEYGVLANHSLVLAGHLARAVTALREMRASLDAY